MTPWTRSDNGMIFGVCQAIAERFDLDVMLVRIAVVLSLFFGGLGFFLYLILALALPKKSNVRNAMNPRVFGVCARFALRFELDVALVRVVALLALLCSGGTALIVYLALYFILPTMAELSGPKRPEGF